MSEFDEITSANSDLSVLRSVSCERLQGLNRVAASRNMYSGESVRIVVRVVPWKMEHVGGLGESFGVHSAIR